MGATLGIAPVDAMRSALAAAAAVALLAALPAGSASRPKPAALIAKGLARADLSPAEKSQYGAVLARARADVRRLPKLRAELLRKVIVDVAAQWRSYTSPRALVLFSTLAVNADWLEQHAVWAGHPDLTADDGVVYRFFSSHGYVFHPLANFAKLNLEAAAGDVEATQRHTTGLLARATPVGSTLVWQYEFSFATGAAPWASGMVQAVAAQALARAGELLSDQALLDAADAAYAAVRRLLSPRSPAKPWVALYSFDRTPVLNAQLQAALSVADYAETIGDESAAAFADRLTDAAARLLPRFDTGYWSLYSLHGDDSPLDYHDYVITLLRKLGARTGEASWGETAERFHAYESQPPVIRVAPLPRTLLRRHKARVRFWLSKPSSVTFRAGKTVVSESFGHGRHTIVWAPKNAVPGTYHPRLTAVGPLGLRVEHTLPPVKIAQAPRPRR
jgi:hypothetical protein